MKFRTILFTGAILFWISVWTASGQSDFYGMTNGGGSHNSGVIFKTDANGDTYQIIKEFSQGDGQNPVVNRLCEVGPDIFYGMTENGGTYGHGVIFQFKPSTGEYQSIYDFNGNTNGSDPWGGLCLGSNGILYGMTERGGAASKGVFFQLDPETNTVVKLLDFDGPEFGAYPRNSVLSASNGKLYGVTSEGGTGMVGVIFEFDPNTYTFSKVAELAGLSDGLYQTGNLVEAPNGKLYGMTYSGGPGGFGVIFEFDPMSHSLLKKIDFDMDVTGAGPMGSLTLASNGLLYGVTVYGGSMNRGVLFEYDPSTNILTPKFNFDGTTTGRSSEGDLVQAPDGKLYGLNPLGGTYNMGVLYQFDPCTGNLAVIHDFTREETGSYPYGTPMMSSDGNLYGLTFRGGSENVGVIFRYSLEIASLEKLYDFKGAHNGSYPKGALQQAANGNLYGLTSGGGLHGGGVIFELNPYTWSYQTVADFESQITGENPQGSLFRSKSGMLYGMTHSGGSAGYGTLFGFDPSERNLSNLVDFTGTSNGQNPSGSLIQASDGFLYGMTTKGGTANLGVLFRFDPDNREITKLYDFDGASHGSFPFGSLFEASDGHLYGMTYAGGVNGIGIIFDFNPETNTLTKRYDFVRENGCNPYGSLVEAEDSKLYGMTYSGGSPGIGTLFSFDPGTNVYTKQLDFKNESNGAYPYGDLLAASNGKLYGMTSLGGYYHSGLSFEYNPETGNFVPRINFHTYAGATPYYGAMIELEHFVPAPVGENMQQFCHTATVALLQATGTDIKWYGSAEGQDLLSGTETLEDGGNYYASQTIDGIESTTRLKVTATILNTEPPSGSPAQIFCNQGTVDDLEADGMQVTWYDSPEEGNELNASVELLNNHAYYASQTISGCESETRFMVTVTLHKPAAPTGDASQDFCQSAFVSDLTATGTDIQWYNAASGGIPLNPSSPVTNGMSCYATQTVEGCESKDRFMVIISIEPNPEALVIQDGQTLTVTTEDAAYRWLDCGNGNLPVSGATEPSFTAPATGSYAVEVTRNGCVAVSVCTDVVITGTEDNMREGSTVFPNPNNGSFQLSGNFSGKPYRIVNSKGKVISSGIISGKLPIITLGNQNRGIYFLQVDGHIFKIVRL